MLTLLVFYVSLMVSPSYSYKSVKCTHNTGDSCITSIIRKCTTCAYKYLPVFIHGLERTCSAFELLLFSFLYIFLFSHVLHQTDRRTGLVQAYAPACIHMLFYEVIGGKHHKLLSCTINMHYGLCCGQ